MSIDVKNVNNIFKKAYGDLLDMAFDPNRKEEYKEYRNKRDAEIKALELVENERKQQIDLLPRLEKGKYKIKILKEMQNYSTSLGKVGEIIEVYNAGPSKHKGSLNWNQDSRALVYDYGMSGTDNYFPTIDFEIIEYLGVDNDI